ncbi:hypothetical protein [uncultured Photobacterium sp.]|uniref:RHS repeat domain-containing protein n=1 Tax=uncultured Photobacterium sp. TaxID=173973 RepID=UPI0026390661|nr:hypothetical protein [uncultured Photobacterium sp.]
MKKEFKFFYNKISLFVLLLISIALFIIVNSSDSDFSPPSSPLGFGYIHHPEGNTGSDCCEHGSATWFVDVNNLNLVIQQTPIWYESAYGPDIDFTLTYNMLGELSEKSNLGNRWVHSYGEFITKNKNNDGFTYHSSFGRIDEYVLSGREFIAETEHLGSGDAALMPKLVVTEDVIKAIYVGGAYKEFRLINDNSYRLIHSVDRTGNSLDLYYKESLLVKIENAEGRFISLIYNNQDRLIQISGLTGYRVSFEYDAQNNLVTINDIQGNLTELGYNDDGHIRSLKNAKDETQFMFEPSDEYTTRYDTYPAFGEPMGMSSRLTITGSLGGKAEYFYNAESGLAWYVDPENYVDYRDSSINNSQNDVAKTIYQYKRYAKGYSRLRKIIYPDNFWESYRYDDNRNLAEIAYSNGDVYKYKNNAIGNVIHSSDLLGNNADYIYDSNQNIIVSSSDIGTETFNYDINNRLISETDSDGYTTRYNYNARGQLKTILNHDQSVLTFDYDRDGRLNKLVTDNNTLVQYTYDSLGRIISEVDEYGNTKRYQYDPYNAVIEFAWCGKNIQIQPSGITD